MLTCPWCTNSYNRSVHIWNTSWHTSSSALDSFVRWRSSWNNSVPRQQSSWPGRTGISSRPRAVESSYSPRESRQPGSLPRISLGSGLQDRTSQGFQRDQEANERLLGTDHKILQRWEHRRVAESSRRRSVDRRFSDFLLLATPLRFRWLAQPPP
jgi:hypothetical protein